MSKKVFAGINTKAKNIKSVYIGSTKARKVIKGYVGINGKAFNFFSQAKHQPVPKYYGYGKDLTKAKDQHGGATVGNYAIFAGGTSGGAASYYKNAEGYSSSLVKIDCSDLATTTRLMGAGQTPTHAIFAGGSVSSVRYNVNTYDSSLTMMEIEKLPNAYKDPGSASGAGMFMMTVGKTCTINDSLTLTSLVDSNLSSGNRGEYNNDHFVFGGADTTNTAAYRPSYTKVNISQLSTKRYRPGCAATTDHILFVGGWSVEPVGLTIDAFDGRSLTKVIVPDIPYLMTNLSSTSVNGHAFFALGGKNQYACAFSPSLVRTDFPNKSTPHNYGSAASIGRYALFSGGQGSSTSKEVKVFTVE